MVSIGKTEKGVVKNILVGKNFGFILSPQSGTEYFFHRQDFNGHWDDLISDHQGGHKIEVEFIPSDAVRGPRASDVRRLDWPNNA
jgi:cold shock CspA family protein